MTKLKQLKQPAEVCTATNHQKNKDLKVDNLAAKIMHLALWRLVDV